MNIPEFSGDILIVDDVPENIKVLSSILNTKGYKVRKALNGKVALRSAKSRAPNVILLDIKMPEMNGYELCQQLKADPSLKEIPVIFISALNEIFDKVKAFKCGGVDYITKPFQIEEVIARIENQLTIQRQKDRLKQEIKHCQEIEDILYQSRSLLASILNTSLDGIAALEAVRKPSTGKIEDFRCLVANPIFAMMVNRHQDHLVGKLIAKKILSQISPGLFDKFVKLVETGQTLQQEIFFQQDNTQEYWYHLVAVKLGDGLSLTVRDITQRKQAELKLESSAKIDSLTGIGNRRLFDQMILQEWNRHKRTQQPLSLIICDIDEFKRYNDHYGHLQGDKCLHQVAQSINRVVKRSGELVARYGGEEFAIILPHTNKKQAVKVAKLIQEEIHQQKIVHAESRVSAYVTMSIGVTSMIPGIQHSLKSLIMIADKALYQAKARGRNHIVLYTIGGQ